MDRCIDPCITVGWFDWRHWLWVVGWVVAGSLGIAPVHAQHMCDGQTYPFPYTDVSTVGPAFCPGIMEAYVTGISKGTSPTTFSPNDDVIRLQMTTFLQRSVDQVLVRPSRRAALNQWWTPQHTASMQNVVVGGDPIFCAADGHHIWTSTDGNVVEVQASTGTVLGTWTGATNGQAVVMAAGKVFVPGLTSPGSLYVIDPTQPPGAVTLAANNLGNFSVGIAFDGTNLWTANEGSPGSVSIISPQSPYTVINTVTAGFNAPLGILYDGAHIWVTDTGAGTLLKLDSMGNVLQTVTVGGNPTYPVFDGANIWVADGLSSITVVQASSGSIVATISQDANNNLLNPQGASFDGERILMANFIGSTVTLFKAADLSFIANISTGGSFGACSDGINFWVPLQGTGNLLRF